MSLSDANEFMLLFFFFFAFLGPFSPAEASPTLDALNLVSFHSEADSWDSVEAQRLLLGEADYCRD